MFLRVIRHMASITRRTDNMRRNKKTKIGQGRKRKTRNKGTTPVFAIHVAS